MKMALGAMLIDTDHTALENREIALDGVGVRVAADPFFLAVINGFMAGEAPPDRAVHIRLIGAEMAGGIGVIENDLADLAAVTVSTLTERAAPPRSTNVTTFLLSPQAFCFCQPNSGC